MGAFEFGPVSVRAASAFTAWTRKLIAALDQLVASREVAAIPHLDDMLANYDRVMNAIDAAVREANRAGTATLDVVRVPMTLAQHRALKDVGRAIESYVGLLATRKLVNMDMTPDQAAGMAALVDGTYVE